MATASIGAAQPAAITSASLHRTCAAGSTSVRPRTSSTKRNDSAAAAMRQITAVVRARMTTDRSSRAGDTGSAAGTGRSAATHTDGGNPHRGTSR